MVSHRRVFDAAFKADAVRSVTVDGRPVAEVAKELGIARGTLAGWIATARSRPEPATGDAHPTASARVESPRSRPAPPTILDVARHAKLSKSVVSRALTGQYGVSDDARERVLAAARELGYVSNTMAQGLSSHRTYTLGVLVRDASAPMYGFLQTALQKHASALGYRVITTTGAGTQDLADERAALKDLIGLRVEGLVVCSGPLPADDIVSYSAGYPVVVAGRSESDPRLDAAFCDEVEGTRSLAAHLVSLGHDRMAVPQVRGELSGLLHSRAALSAQAVRDAGAAPVLLPCSGTEDAGRLVDEALAAGCSAMIAPNDRYAVEVLEALRLRGVRAPDDFSVTGFDGIGPLSSDFLGLTTWRQPIEAIGQAAVDLLLEQLDGWSRPARHVALPGSLQVGRTTGPRA